MFNNIIFCFFFQVWGLTWCLRWSLVIPWTMRPPHSVWVQSAEPLASLSLNSYPEPYQGNKKKWIHQSSSMVMNLTKPTYRVLDSYNPYIKRSESIKIMRLVCSDRRFRWRLFLLAILARKIAPIEEFLWRTSDHHDYPLCLSGPFETTKDVESSELYLCKPAGADTAPAPHPWDIFLFQT